jgi:hypothetical protein
MGAASLIELFDEKYYTALPGGILENFGRLFKNDLKVFVYPLREHQTDEMTTVENLQVAPELRKLHGYLTDRGSFIQLDNFNPDYLHIFSRDVLKRIAAQDESWENMVPAQVADIIKKRGFFGYSKHRAD